MYLVEGYMDVVSLNSKGIENVVANLGTSLTDRQVSVLNQFYDDFKLIERIIEKIDKIGRAHV